MNQTILFSPVGGTDPISATNCRDGSLLHICRVRKPNKVILYMSQEVLENQKKDNRYLYCLEKLAKMQKRNMTYEIIERKELKEVQEFDYFYQDFRELIAKMVQEMDETDQLLLNVSSGTPAMKSALLVLRTLGEFPCSLIQVSTPVKRMNETIHKDYDVETLWELNEDNAVDFEDRCSEIQCPTLSVIKNEEIIKKHVAVYDYQAALTVAQSIPAEEKAAYLDLIKLASRRLLLDFSSVDRILAKKKFHYTPILKGKDRECFEYALILDVKLRREEYADFIRAITPLFVDLLELILKRRYGIDIDDYCSRDEKDIRKWDAGKLKGTQVLRILDGQYPNGFKGTDVYSDHLGGLLKKLSDDREMKEIIRKLRRVERDIRNIAAHQIVSITEETIKKLTEDRLTGRQIMKLIKSLFRYADMDIKDSDWDSYDIMNEQIFSLMKRG